MSHSIDGACTLTCIIQALNMAHHTPCTSQYRAALKKNCVHVQYMAILSAKKCKIEDTCLYSCIENFASLP